MVAVLGVVDLGERGLRARLRRLRQRGKNVGDDLWNQHRCSRVSGNTSRTAFQNPSAPSPTASTGAVIPRRWHDRSRSAHDSVDSRNPSASATSSLRAVGADPDHHQQAHLVLLEADLEVDPVDPHVDVVGVRPATAC